MSKSYPKWKPRSNRISEFPYIEGCVLTDVVIIPVSNETKTKTMYCYITTDEAKEFVEVLNEAIRVNERVKGIRTQEHTMRWF